METSGTCIASSARELGAPLGEGEIAEVLRRWQAGENLKRIANDYKGVSYSILKRRTRLARKKILAEEGRQGVLNAEQIANAVTRWEAGETLRQIADSYGVTYSVLSYATKAARAGKTTAKFLTPAQTESAVIRWRAGERLAMIALEYGVTRDTLYKSTKSGRSRK